MDFTNYSFDELVQTATTYVQNAPGWGQAYNSSFGQTLIQLMAQMTQQLNYMMERRTQESFMVTAKLTSSIWALASAIGYRPSRKVSATGAVTIQLQDSSGIPLNVAAGGTVTIPKYTQFTYNNQNFVNTDDINILAGTNVSSANIIKEGLLNTETMDPNDSTTTLFSGNYILLTNYTSIENTSLLISDGNGPWYDVTTSINGAAPIGALSFAGPTDRVYDIKINTQGMKIVFGDGVTGMKPNAVLTIKWITSSGTAVNIVTTGNDFLLPTQTLGDNLVVVPANVYYYTITNTTPIDGAIDEETVQQITQNAPDFVRSADRAVNNADYAFWTRKSAIGGIVDAIAYGQQEAGVNPYQMNNVYVTYLTNTAAALDLTDADSLRTYLANLETLTAYVVLQAATVIPVQVNLRIKKNPNLTMANSQFYDLINLGLQAFFPLQKGSLGEEIDASDITTYFQDYQVANNNQNINAAKWVSLNMYPLFAVTTPLNVSTIPVSIQAGTTGDAYTLKINGITYSFAMTSGQNAAQIANSLIAILPGSLVTATNPISASHAGSVTSVTVNTPGGGYTTPPSVALSGAVGGSGFAATSTLKAQTPTVQAVGSGYHVNDLITLTNGVVLKVLTISGSNVATVSINSSPALTGTMATNPVAQSSVSPTGGTGATFNLDYGVNTVVVSNTGTGYTAVSGATVSGGHGGTYTAVDATIAPVTTSGYIVLTSAVPQTTFSIDNDGSTVPGNVGITQNIQLPPYLFSNQNTQSINLFYPGTIQIVNAGNGTVLYTDNGAGTIAGGTVSYVTGLISIPILPSGSYYIRYQQDVDQNLYSNNQCAFKFSPLNPVYGDSTFYFSTVTIL